MPHTPSRIRDPTCSDPTRWCQLCPSADARPDGASGNLLVGPLAERQCHGLHSAQQASSRTPSCAYITSCVQLRGAEHRGQAKGRSHPRCSGCDCENAQRSQIRSVAGPCPSFATRCDEHSRQKRLYGGRGEEEEEHDAREFARERHGTHAHSSKVRVWQRRRQHTRKETGGAALCRGPTKDEEWERREGKAEMPRLTRHNLGSGASSAKDGSAAGRACSGRTAHPAAKAVGCIRSHSTRGKSTKAHAANSSSLPVR